MLQAYSYTAALEGYRLSCVKTFHGAVYTLFALIGGFECDNQTSDVQSTLGDLP